MLRFAILAAICLAGLRTTAFGQPITILNPSFESPGSAPGQFTGGTATGPSNWQVYNTVAANTQRYFGVVNTSTTQLYFDPVPHGTNIGVVFLDNDNAFQEAGLRQTLSATLQANTRYTLRVKVGNMATDPALNPSFDFSGFPGYRVELLAGTSVIASDNNTLTPGEGRFLTSTIEAQTGAFHPNLGQSLGIRLVNLNGEGIEVNFDNVRLDAAAVPEPVGLLGLLVGTWMVRRIRNLVRDRFLD